MLSSVFKWILFFILLTTIIGGSIVGIYIYQRNNQQILNSPLVNIFKPDFKSRIKNRIIISPKLIGDVTKRFDKVPKNIQYLSYNLDTRRIYASKGISEPIAPGSFVKLVTSMVALDLLTPDTLLTASKDSINKEPTVLGLKEGEQISILDLIRSSIATSANDAASTLALGTAKILGLDITDYLDLMNQKVALMGMVDTHLTNPEGYDDPGQITTILDLVKLIDHALGYKEIVSSAKSDMENIQATSTHGFYYLPNWNGLLGIYEGVYGLKIARTEKAGYCTIVLSRRNNINIAIIISGAKTLQERDQTAADLLDFSFNYEKVKPLKITPLDLKKKYQIWNDLSSKIKSELGIK